MFDECFFQVFISCRSFCECLRLAFNGLPKIRIETPCGETTIYYVPIYGRQPCTLASISLCSLIAHAFCSSPLHRLSPAFPFLTYRAVNADKRYPLPRLLPSVSESKNSVNNSMQISAFIRKLPNISAIICAVRFVFRYYLLSLQRKWHAGVV